MPLFVAFPEAGAVSKRCLGSCQSAPEHVRPRLKAKSSKTLQSGTSGYSYNATLWARMLSCGQVLVAVYGHSGLQESKAC